MISLWKRFCERHVALSCALGSLLLVLVMFNIPYVSIGHFLRGLMDWIYIEPRLYWGIVVFLGAFFFCYPQKSSYSWSGSVSFFALLVLFFFSVISFVLIDWDKHNRPGVFLDKFEGRFELRKNHPDEIARLCEMGEAHLTMVRASSGEAFGPSVTVCEESVQTRRVSEVEWNYLGCDDKECVVTPLWQVDYRDAPGRLEFSSTERGRNACLLRLASMDERWVDRLTINGKPAARLLCGEGANGFLVTYPLVSSGKASE